MWTAISGHHAQLAASGELTAKRRRQLVGWTRAMVRAQLLARLDEPSVRAEIERCEAAVLEGTLSPEQATAAILDATVKIR